MGFWSEVFLGVIAFATLTMAIIQVLMVVYGWNVARRLERSLSEVEQQMKPLAESLNSIARDAAGISSLASGQVERLDRLVYDVTSRIEHTASTVQDTILRPLRDGAALMSGVKAAIELFRELNRRPADGRGRPDDEDALFIG